MIQIKNVTKLYPAKETGNGGGKDPGAIHALDHISVHVASGEWLSIMGPSGSGKSTLVNLIGCLDRPSSGEIWLDGQDVAGISAAELNRVRAEKIGFIFQQFHLIPFLTAVENVMLAQYFHSMTDEKEAVEASSRDWRIVALNFTMERLLRRKYFHWQMKSNWTRSSKNSGYWLSTARSPKLSAWKYTALCR